MILYKASVALYEQNLEWSKVFKALIAFRLSFFWSLIR